MWVTALRRVRPLLLLATRVAPTFRTYTCNFNAMSEAKMGGPSSYLFQYGSVAIASRGTRRRMVSLSSDARVEANLCTQTNGTGLVPTTPIGVVLLRRRV